MVTTPGTNAWETTRPYRVLVDESEVGGYSMTAVLIRLSDVQAVRTVLRGHLRGTQRSIHFTKERDAVRRAFLEEVTSLPIKAQVHVTGSKARGARAACLRSIVRAVDLSACRSILLDQDDSVLRPDNRVLREAVGPSWDGTYDHLHDHEEPLLWLPHAISWCWNKGGQWRHALDAIDLKVVHVEV